MPAKDRFGMPVMNANPQAEVPAVTIIRIKGKDTEVPSAQICGNTVIVTGKLLKTAKLHDEELVEGEPVRDPGAFLNTLKRSALSADLFTFAQKPPVTAPKFDYRSQWENWAVIRTTSFSDWWEKMLPQESRKNVRRAAKRGVLCRTVPFTDELVEGIRGIYNETPVRQGKPFWHFGKDFETVKRENITYLERSEFIGAFLNDELIGFIKIIHVDRVAVMIQILAKNAHHDKRPMNALLAHTVELCEKKRSEFLTYGQYVYGAKQNSSLTEFKRRNGFEELKFPRYYVPLTFKGKLAITTGLHLGIRNAIPGPVNELILKGRALACRAWYGSRQPSVQES
jgi:hypothetical protein